MRKSSLIPSCSDSIVFFYTSQWFHWILLFCAGTGLLEFKIHNIFMSSVFQTFNWAFLVSFDSIVSIICWANYLLLNMRCCMYMSNSYLSSCFHVCSCMVMILNWSSVISMTGWKSFHYTKERPMLKITRRMRKRGWWENTRYHRLGDILPKCLLQNRNYWNSYFPPSGFLLGVSHWSRRGWRHPLSDNQRDPTKFPNQSVGPSVYYQGLLIIGVICLLLMLLLLSKISPNIWDFHCLFDLQATNLAPQDLNGKSDPYLLVRIGQQTLDTKDRYIPKQLNPTFGESVLYPPLHLSPALWLGECLTPSMLCTFFQGVWIHSVLPAGNRIARQSFGPWSRGVRWCDRWNAAWPRESLLQPPQSHLWSGSLLRHVSASLAYC